MFGSKRRLYILAVRIYMSSEILWQNAARCVILQYWHGSLLAFHQQLDQQGCTQAHTHMAFTKTSYTQ